MSLLLERVTKSYREPGGKPIPVLGIERFAMNQGEQVALIGSSGGGKTTLLNTLSSFIQNDHRVITIEDAAELGIETWLEIA